MASKSKGKDVAIAAIIILIGLGAVAAFGFYKDETTSFVRLQAWDLSPVDRGTKRFVEAAAKGDGDAVMTLLGPESDQVMPKKKNGKLVSFMVPDYGGPVERTLKALAPTSSPEYGKPQWIALDGGAVTQRIDFANHAIVLRWDRLAAGWRIIGISRILN